MKAKPYLIASAQPITPPPLTWTPKSLYSACEIKEVVEQLLLRVRTTPVVMNEVQHLIRHAAASGEDPDGGEDSGAADCIASTPRPRGPSPSKATFGATVEQLVDSL